MQRAILSVRLPPWLHEAIKKAARLRDHSMNHEIVRRLEQSLKRSGEITDAPPGEQE